MSDHKRTDPIAGDIVHVYDDIEEADNELPRWWVAGFIASIIFSAGYWLALHEYDLVPIGHEALALQQAEIDKRSGTVSEAGLLATAQDQSAVAAGKEAFVRNCVVCHGDSAQGNIGPNLTDRHWLHGGAGLDVHRVIQDGVGEKGMPPWGPVLGGTTVKQLTAYVLSLRDTNVPGKEPQGEVWPK